MAVEGLVSSTVRFTGGESGSEDGMDKKNPRLNNYRGNIINELKYFTFSVVVVVQFYIFFTALH